MSQATVPTKIYKRLERSFRDINKCSTNLAALRVLEPLGAWLAHRLVNQMRMHVLFLMQSEALSYVGKSWLLTQLNKVNIPH